MFTELTNRRVVYFLAYVGGKRQAGLLILNCFFLLSIINLTVKNGSRDERVREGRIWGYFSKEVYHYHN